MADAIDSTNEWAKRVLSEKAISNGTIFQAAHQSEGKGQKGKIWKSDWGLNALFTIVLKSKFIEYQKLPYLNFSMALATADAIKSYVSSKPVYIKWPNDIYIGDKKIAGILIENTSERGERYSMVGIGMNVNQAEFASDLVRATSLMLALGKSKDVLEIIQRVVTCIEKRYYDLIQKRPLKHIQEEYVELLYMKEQMLQIVEDKAINYAKVRGVDALGRLVVSNDQGSQSISHGEKELRWNW
jgi:BirA family biotin operon repressor/biotin-[acetyl-CoA-carboxylase] ligase